MGFLTFLWFAYTSKGRQIWRKWFPHVGIPAADREKKCQPLSYQYLRRLAQAWGWGSANNPQAGERKDEALLIQKELMGVCQTGAVISSSMAGVILVLPVLAQRQDDNLN